MEALNNPFGSIKMLLGKYKYAMIVVLIGLGLMLLPTGSAAPSASVTDATTPTTVASDLESKLAEILGRIDGAGKVAVLLTERNGSETVYQTDTQSESGNGTERLDAETVMVGSGNRGETGLVRRTDAPIYQGAIIVCQGGDNPQVRLAIVEAVQCVTGLGANEIAVVKMK